MWLRSGSVSGRRRRSRMYVDKEVKVGVKRNVDVDN